MVSGVRGGEAGWGHPAYRGKQVWVWAGCPHPACRSKAREGGFGYDFSHGVPSPRMQEQSACAEIKRGGGTPPT